ncbi:MAG: nicotinate phosphoribosyltransferase [Chloroflexi bacterium]|nr:nicotinate phosphoribosyltransferase [Chloroflexota bacterium]MCY3571935.1 nicotinate phosphoribosyltransferase [Chloroflexota bacterium]
MNTPSALFVDLYELTMAQLYYERGMTREAVFELTVRELPEQWDYLIAAGLDRALSFLEQLRFSEDDLEFLGSLPQFSQAFIDQLGRLRFTGDVWAPPEGAIVYPDEPLVQVIAPLAEAQIIETAMINQIAFPTLVASKAARAVDAAAGRPVIEFGGRRAHGAEAAIEASRATYIAGFEATSSVEAGRRFGVPITGTMAHSFVLAEGDEAEAFDAFVSRYPGTTLLVDTYDTQPGVANAVRTARRFGPGSVGAIRIDSGDLRTEAWQARVMLDTAGLSDVRIVASGGLDEYQIADLLSANAPIDIFACGTSIVAPPDAATLDSAYKMVEYDGRPVAKRSPGKPGIGHRKQVWRLPEHDLIARFDEPPLGEAEPLLQQVMAAGQRTAAGSESLTQMRARAAVGRVPRRVETDPSLLR